MSSGMTPSPSERITPSQPTGWSLWASLLRPEPGDAGSVGPMPLVGTPVARCEDHRLLTGGARFIANLDLPGALCVTYVISPVAHAVIRSIDTDATRSVRGVVDVVTAADLDLGPQPQLSPAYPPAMARPLLADCRVRFVGEAVAAIVSETEAAGEDAAELVDVDYEILPAVVGLDAAEGGEVLLFPEAGTNVVTTREGGTDTTASELSACQVVMSATLVNQRLAPCPLEGRAGAARWEEDGRLVHWSSCQGAHPVRDLLAQVYGLEPHQVRVIAPDVGGSFGAKARPHPEEVLLAWLARGTGRPVRWVPPRSTDMVGLGHSRAQRQHVELGGDRDGTIRALRVRIDGDAGAYPVVGPLLVANTAVMAPGAYRIPAVHWSTRAFVTNTTPIVAYRGAGRPEATALIERAIDLFTAELGRDPAAVRRHNMLRTDEFPYESATAIRYDSGDYLAAVDQVLEAAGYEGLRAEQSRRRARHRRGPVPRRRGPGGAHGRLGRARGPPSRPARGPGAAMRDRLRRRGADRALRRLRRRGRGRPGHRRGRAAAPGDRRRRRHDHQPGPGARAGARRVGPGHRSGPVRGVQLRRRRQPADDQPRGLRLPVGRRDADLRMPAGADAVTQQPPRRQGHRRIRHDRRAAGRAERRDRRAGAPGRAPHRPAPHARARLAGHQRLCQRSPALSRVRADRTFFCTLPDAVRGSSSTKRQMRGIFWGARPASARKAASSSSVVPCLARTKAAVCPPSRGWGAATTATSRTAWWTINVSSISRDDSFSPPRLIVHQ